MNCSMGCSCTKQNEKLDSNGAKLANGVEIRDGKRHFFHYKSRQKAKAIANANHSSAANANSTTPMTIGAMPSTNYHYIAMALLNANRAASLVVHDICPGHLDELVADQLIRKAKNDGRTVSVVNGCLYLDYKFAGFMPMIHV